MGSDSPTIFGEAMMARLIKDVMEEVFCESPKPPVTETFTYQHLVDDLEIRELRRNPGYVESIKRQMTHALVDFIIKKCQLFQMPKMHDLERGIPIRMELTINDRGTYENALPRAREKAFREGVKSGADEVIKSLPHGFEPDQYYE